MINLERYFEKIPFHTELKFNKRFLPNLPSGFKSTIAGDPRIGMKGQYRYGTLHAYDFGDCWLIHKDRWNPETHLWEHMVEDAPHWLAVVAAAVVAPIVFGAVLFGYLSDIAREAQSTATNSQRGPRQW